jgi:hypothetical protein
VVDESCGEVFCSDDPGALTAALEKMTRRRDRLRDMGRAAAKRAWEFDVARTEAAVVGCMADACK